MDRRKFIKYSGLAAAGFTFVACGGRQEHAGCSAAVQSRAQSAGWRRQHIRRHLLGNHQCRWSIAGTYGDVRLG